MNADPTFQPLIYKLCPNLSKTETFKERGSSKKSCHHSSCSCDENICVVLEYFSIPMTVELLSDDDYEEVHNIKKKFPNPTSTIFRRFFRCKGSTPLTIFDKIIKDKLNHQDDFTVHFVQNQINKEIPLETSLSELATSSGWLRKRPLRLMFTVIPSKLPERPPVLEAEQMPILMAEQEPRRRTSPVRIQEPKDGNCFVTPPEFKVDLLTDSNGNQAPKIRQKSPKPLAYRTKKISDGNNKPPSLIAQGPPPASLMNEGSSAAPVQTQSHPRLPASSSSGATQSVLNVQQLPPQLISQQNAQILVKRASFDQPPTLQAVSPQQMQQGPPTLQRISPQSSANKSSVPQRAPQLTPAERPQSSNNTPTQPRSQLQALIQATSPANTSASASQLTATISQTLAALTETSSSNAAQRQDERPAAQQGQSTTSQNGTSPQVTHLAPRIISLPSQFGGQMPVLQRTGGTICINPQDMQRIQHYVMSQQQQRQQFHTPPMKFKVPNGSPSSAPTAQSAQGNMVQTPKSAESASLNSSALARLVAQNPATITMRTAKSKMTKKMKLDMQAPLNSTPLFPVSIVPSSMPSSASIQGISIASAPTRFGSIQPSSSNSQSPNQNSQNSAPSKPSTPHPAVLVFSPCSSGQAGSHGATPTNGSTSIFPTAAQLAAMDERKPAVNSSTGAHPSKEGGHQSPNPASQSSTPSEKPSSLLEEHLQKKRLSTSLVMGAPSPKIPRFETSGGLAELLRIKDDAKSVEIKKENHKEILMMLEKKSEIRPVVDTAKRDDDDVMIVDEVILNKEPKVITSVSPAQTSVESSSRDTVHDASKPCAQTSSQDSGNVSADENSKDSLHEAAKTILNTAKDIAKDIARDIAAHNSKKITVTGSAKDKVKEKVTDTANAPAKANTEDSIKEDIKDIVLNTVKDAAQNAVEDHLLETFDDSAIQVAANDTVTTTVIDSTPADSDSSSHATSSHSSSHLTAVPSPPSPSQPPSLPLSTNSSNIPSPPALSPMGSMITESINNATSSESTSSSKTNESGKEAIDIAAIARIKGQPLGRALKAELFRKSVPSETSTLLSSISAAPKPAEESSRSHEVETPVAMVSGTSV